MEKIQPLTTTVGGNVLSGGDLFKREVRNIGALASVLDGDATDLAFGIEIKQCVLVQVFCFRHIRRPQLNVQRIGILKVLYFHGENPRSKKALWTVSPSGNKITRKHLLPTSETRPSAENGHPAGPPLL